MPTTIESCYASYAYFANHRVREGKLGMWHEKIFYDADRLEVLAWNVARADDAGRK